MRFNKGIAKSDLDWVILRAKKLPGARSLFSASSAGAFRPTGHALPEEQQQQQRYRLDSR